MIAEEFAPDRNHTGVLLFQELPYGMYLGFDNTSWKVESKFKGIKNIPDGCHYLHYSLSDEKNMFQIGRFLMFGQARPAGQYPQQTVIVLKWNKQYQDFVRVTGYEETVAGQAVKDGHYDCYLGGYPNQRIAIWQQSTNHITQEVLDKLDPLHTIHHIGQEYDRRNDQVEQAIEYLNIDDEENEYPQQEQTYLVYPPPAPSTGSFNNIQGSIYYTDVPKKLTGEPSDTTKVNLDKSPILEFLLAREYKGVERLLLGELQYSFVCFLLGCSLDSLYQWKKLINVVCFSETTFLESKRLSFLLEFIVVLFGQLKQLPKDFFVDELSKESFMVACLRRLMEYQVEQDVPMKLRKRIGKIFELLETHFGYQLETEEEDYGPTVVDCEATYF